MKHSHFVLPLIFFLHIYSYSQIVFDAPDLGTDNSLLFSITATIPGVSRYTSLFISDLITKKVAQLSVYPEHIRIAENSKRLFIQNRFGLFSSFFDTQERKFTPLSVVPNFPSFLQGDAVKQGKQIPALISPDGFYALALQKGTAGFARLVLYDFKNNQEILIAPKVNNSVDVFPALWSPDSSLLIYYKEDSLYYFSMAGYAGNQILDEKYRKIGEGRIANARWSNNGSLYYITGSSLFIIYPAEFFHRGLYEGISGIGSIANTLPFPFDPNFDIFWLSPDDSKLLFSRGGRNLFLVTLGGLETDALSLPYLFFPSDTKITSVFWPDNKNVTILTRSLKGGSTTNLYRINIEEGKALSLSSLYIDAPPLRELSLSPDGSKVALVNSLGVIIRSFSDWAHIENLVPTKNDVASVHANWVTNDILIIATEDKIEAVQLGTKNGQFLALSQVTQFGRTAEGMIQVISSPEGPAYQRPELAGDNLDKAISQGELLSNWQTTNTYLVKPASTSNSQFRVYLDAQGAGSFANGTAFENRILLRVPQSSLPQNLTTQSLLQIPQNDNFSFPTAEEPLRSQVFSHGSRIRRREVSITFDILGIGNNRIAPILQTLQELGLKATFFVHSEFLRQNPTEAKLLAESGQEVAIIFLDAQNPANSTTFLDEDYFRRGLSKMEDDWFALTKKELSLFWHTPNYTVSQNMLNVSKRMNYVFVGRDIDPLDWVTKEDRAKMPAAYYRSHQIIDRIMSTVKPGSIIPVRVGFSDFSRDDYLYNEIRLLLDSLHEAGYKVVPVSSLIEGAK